MPLWKKIRKSIAVSGEIDVILVGGRKATLFGDEWRGELTLDVNGSEQRLEYDGEYEWRHAVHKLHVVNVA